MMKKSSIIVHSTIVIDDSSSDNDDRVNDNNNDNNSDDDDNKLFDLSKYQKLIGGNTTLTDINDIIDELTNLIADASAATACNGGRHSNDSNNTIINKYRKGLVSARKYQLQQSIKSRQREKSLTEKSIPKIGHLQFTKRINVEYDKKEKEEQIKLMEESKKELKKDRSIQRELKPPQFNFGLKKRPVLQHHY